LLYHIILRIVLHYVLYYIILFFQSGQYIGDPIDCFTPGEFTPQWFKYTDQVCWVKNTYYVPTTQNIPQHSQRKGTVELGLSYSITTSQLHTNY